jgi:plastocyanin
MMGCRKTTLTRVNFSGPHVWHKRVTFSQDAEKVRQREVCMKSKKAQQWGWVFVLAVTCGFWWEAAGPVFSQSEQVVEVTIKDFKFVTKQGPLQLGLPSVIKIRNEDAERHDFGSSMFEGIPTQVEKDGVIVYGRGMGGVLLDPKRDASIRFTMSRPGRHEFRCSIHPNMTGELLLLSVDAV